MDGGLSIALNYLQVVDIKYLCLQELGSTPHPHSLEQRCHQRKTFKPMNSHWLGSER